MEVEHPTDKVDQLEHLLNTKEIKYTKHFEEDRLPRRQNVTKELIENHLREPEELIDFRYEKDDHIREKYQLLFDKSTKYYLKVVISFSKEALHIVTAHVLNKAKNEKAKVLS